MIPPIQHSLSKPIKTEISMVTVVVLRIVVMAGAMTDEEKMETEMMPSLQLT